MLLQMCDRSAVLLQCEHLLFIWPMPASSISSSTEVVPLMRGAKSNRSMQNGRLRQACLEYDFVPEIGRESTREFLRSSVHEPLKRALLLCVHSASENEHLDGCGQL